MKHPIKSSKKLKDPVGFKIYRDQKGRFISKVDWQAISKRKRKSASVAVQRDAKGRFKFEKFLPATVKVAPEKKKKKLKKKPKPKCNYSKVFELIDQRQINKVNVTGISNLSVYCLASLIDNQIERGAYLFRFWFEGNAYYKGDLSSRMRSTRLIDVTRFRNDFPTTEKFLQSLGGSVLYYWMDLHAKPKIR